MKMATAGAIFSEWVPNSKTLEILKYGNASVPSIPNMQECTCTPDVLLMHFPGFKTRYCKYISVTKHHTLTCKRLETLNESTLS